MLPKSRINRRQFIKRISGAAVAGFGIPYIVSSSSLGEGGATAAGDRITLGFIGVGMQGRGLLWAFLQQPSCRVVAICDAYGDFRELLARKDIDGVVIATPDHWHSVMAIEACKAGKDVYCEKAMAMSVAEVRQVVNEVRRCERIFQTGSMQRSDLKFHQACELVRNGYIGEVKSVRLFLGMMLGGTSFPIYPVGCDLPSEPTPDVLDWDMWLGPAPWRPYNSRIAPPMDVPGWPHWRDYEDYAGGLMTDWGAHHFDIAQWGLGMDASGPVEIYPENSKDIKMLTYKYANGTTVVRDDTMKYKSVEFTGTEGTVEVSREFIRTVPQSLIRQRIGPDGIRLYKSENHYTNWLDCIRSRRDPICDAEIGCRSATVCHLGVIANQLGRPLKWDPVAERFINDAEADRFLSRPMRSPWKLA
jgi:predicted dehydrogenase